MMARRSQGASLTDITQTSNSFYVGQATDIRLDRSSRGPLLARHDTCALFSSTSTNDRNASTQLRSSRARSIVEVVTPVSVTDGTARAAQPQPRVDVRV